jgi:hypothetical protein
LVFPYPTIQSEAALTHVRSHEAGRGCSQILWKIFTLTLTFTSIGAINMPAHIICTLLIISVSYNFLRAGNTENVSFLTFKAEDFSYLP